MTTIQEPMPHIHNFSDGYYLVNGLYVEPRADLPAPRIQDHVYAQLQEQYYEQIQTPILFRHNGTKYHFRIQPADGVRTDTIEMPASVVDEMSVDHIPSEEQFLMAKPGHAQTIVDLASPDIGGAMGD
jgi:hypothetical protein